MIQVQKRQVYDLPPLEIIVTQHEGETVVCQFPEGVTNLVQYGSGVKQLVLYLKHHQLIPYGRSQQFVADVFKLSLSPDTVQNITCKGAEGVEPVRAKIKEALPECDVIHLDESGCYIAGERHWLHTTSTPHLTYYQAHKSRGRLPLPSFLRIAIPMQGEGDTGRDQNRAENGEDDADFDALFLEDDLGGEIVEDLK